MKRIISLLFAFTFFIIASAQIKDEFWGCKLGTTTKAQLISKLQDVYKRQGLGMVKE